MDYPLLSRISGPRDVKALSRQELDLLCAEIRSRLIAVTSRNGGHIGPNLGVVELTVALHRIFDSPADRFIFDVSHQGYVHKLLTGRTDEKFDRLRQDGGYSGFLSRAESEHDFFGAGHAGTALSAALGMAAARDQMGGAEHVVAVCGDAAFTCGVTMEALNNVKDATGRLIIILNDNEWSIDKNVGAISRTLNELITNPVYNRMSQDLENFLSMVPGGDRIRKLGSRWKKETKDFFVQSSLFESYGLRYIGPIDGHDLHTLEEYLEFAKNSPEPILLHVITTKGKGYEVAMQKPEKFHGSGPYDPKTGSGPKSPPNTPASYQDVFGKHLLRRAREDHRVVGVTGAMPSGTGLSHLRDTLPGQYYDVGIAEEHAVLFAAGMATRGMKPICAIYSTFLQRAYDMIIHDVCLQNLPVVFCMDRAGLSPNDGPTHHGVFDISYLRCVPNAIVMQPKDEAELVCMMDTGLAHQGPTFIRYPRGNGEGAAIPDNPSPLPIGKAEIVHEGHNIWIWALGPMVATAVKVAKQLEAESGAIAGVVNARFAKPVDRELLCSQALTGDLIISMEDHVLAGGFGSAILEVLSDAGISCPVERIGWNDRFIDHGSSVEQLRETAGIAHEQILSKVKSAIGRITGASPAGKTHRPVTAAG